MGYSTVADVVRHNLCTGCGVCAANCPRHAISIVLDPRKCTFQPDIKWNMCNNCSLCVRVCPGLGIDITYYNQRLFGANPRDNRLGHYLRACVGYCTDTSVRVGAASGGLVSGLLIYALEKGLIDGALVARMKKDNPLMPETIIATTREDVLSARKSLYCPVNVADTLPLLRNSGTYAFVGLPCHVHGLRKAQELYPDLRNSTVLALGIFCSCGRTFRATQNMLASHGIDPYSVQRLEYRSDEWSVDLILRMKNGAITSISKYYSSKEFAPFVNFRCTLCIDHANELADVSLGDAWHIGAEKTPGQSVMLVRTAKAMELINQAAAEGRISFTTTSRDSVLQSQANMVFKKDHIGARFFWVSLIGKHTPVFGHAPALKRDCKLQALWFYLSHFVLFRRKGTRRVFAVLRRVYRTIRGGSAN